ncbi:MAG: NusG domain II-containing protein [Clostridiales bacterium]|nr:NusG domain II-containing protein [Clostridiales bacterium]
MKRRDLLLVLILAATALVLYGIGHRNADKPGSFFSVTIEGTEVYRGKLSETGQYPFRQEDGSYNLVRVRDGKVWMEEANCRDGLCVQQGKTDSAAKSIVCLPHSLVVSVVGDAPENRGEELDVIVQ